jgi:hypothetical protein
MKNNKELENNAIAKLYKSGLSLRLVGNAVGLNYETIRARLDKMGIDRRESGKHSVDNIKINSIGVLEIKAIALQEQINGMIKQLDNINQEIKTRKNP